MSDDGENLPAFVESPVDAALMAARDQGTPGLEEIARVMNTMAANNTRMMRQTVASYGLDKVDLRAWARNVFLMEYLRDSAEDKLRKREEANECT